MALRQSKKISELTALTSASLDTVVVGVDNGTTYKIELDILANAVANQINTLDDIRLDNLEAATGSYLTIENLDNLGYAITGSNNFIGNQTFSGSLIPITGDGTLTSSFSLGDETHAWKDIWVSNGTIHFVGEEGLIRDTLSATADGLELTNLLANGSITSNLILNPQTLSTSVTIPEYYNGLLMSPVAVKDDITIETGGILTII